MNKNINEYIDILDCLMDSDDWHVRKALAEQGYELNTLVNDRDWRVREVANLKLNKVTKNEKDEFDSYLEDVKSLTTSLIKDFDYIARKYGKTREEVIEFFKKILEDEKGIQFIECDQTTKEWLKKQPHWMVFTANKCDKCGLHYNPKLGHKCKL